MGSDSVSEGKKQKSGGGLFRRNTKHKESSSASASASSPQQQSNESSSNKPEPTTLRRNIFSASSSPLRRRGRGGGGGGGGQANINDNGANDDAAAAATAPAVSTFGLSYDSYYSNNNHAETAGVDFDDGGSFHSARQLKHTEDDYDNVHRKTTTTTATTTTSWLCRTKYFRNICDAAFVAIDQDESGSVDEKELYAGLLLIHLNLGMYAGPAACKPLGRERVHVIFVEMDADQSGSLDQEEFVKVMMLLFSNVLFRVMVQWSMTLLIVPLIAQALLDFIYAICNFLYQIIVNLDEYSHVANHVELTVEAMGEALLDQMPSVILKLAAKAGHLLKAIPDAVWNSIPLTLLSTILGMLVVPYLILKVDDFFQHLAATTRTTTRRSSNNGTKQQTAATTTKKIQL